MARTLALKARALPWEGAGDRENGRFTLGPALTPPRAASEPPPAASSEPPPAASRTASWRVSHPARRRTRR